MYFSEKGSELFHPGYTMIDRFRLGAKLLTHVLNALRRPTSFSVELLQTMFGLVLSMFLEEEILKEDKSQKLCEVIVSHGVERKDGKPGLHGVTVTSLQRNSS